MNKIARLQTALLVCAIIIIGLIGVIIAMGERVTAAEDERDIFERCEMGDQQACAVVIELHRALNE